MNGNRSRLKLEVLLNEWAIDITNIPTIINRRIRNGKITRKGFRVVVKNRWHSLTAEIIHQTTQPDIPLDIG